MTERIQTENNRRSAQLIWTGEDIMAPSNGRSSSQPYTLEEVRAWLTEASEWVRIISREEWAVTLDANMRWVELVIYQVSTRYERWI